MAKGKTYMKCPVCKGKKVEQILIDGMVDIVNCKCCSGTGVVEPLTNEEWFCRLSTEEKAMVIICCCPYESDWFGDNFEKRIEQRIKDISKATYGYEHGVNKIKNWLKQPHAKVLKK